MDLKSQKRMAADVLDCGENKVWIDPDQMDEVADAITKADIRRFIQRGLIKKKGDSGQSRGRARKTQKQKDKGRRKGHGSRKGSSGAKETDKERWMSKIRAQRKLLKKLRDEGKINSSEYRNLYEKAKGNYFQSKEYLKEYINENIIDGEKID